MSDVIMHLSSSSPEKALEDAKKELQAAQAAFAAIGKKGLLERQTTYDKKLADAQTAIEEAQTRLMAAQAAVDTAKIGDALRPKTQEPSKEPEVKVATQKAPETNVTAEKLPLESQQPKQAAPISTVSAAAERVRKLKAEGAPQVEVRAAVEAHALAHVNALKDANASEDEVKAAVLNYVTLTEDPLVMTPLEAAKRNVRLLKAQGASPDAVKAAVEAYVSLADAESKTTANEVAWASSPTIQEAAERVRALKAAKAPQDEVKAAVEAYIALDAASKQAELKTPMVAIQPGPLEAAAERVRSLKAARAPQEEVKAAVEAYLALTGATSSPQEHSKTTLETVSRTPLEISAEKVRTLKAARAPQAEVKAAVEEYVSLTGNVVSSPAEPVDAAAEKVRALKAARAPQADVKAAVDSYVALMTSGKPVARTPLEIAAEKVRLLKANIAAQAEVKAACEAYAREEAAEKVRVLKASNASQPAVKAAVEAYLALLPQAEETKTERQENQTSTDLEMAANNVRALKAANAPQEQVKAAVEAYIALCDSQDSEGAPSVRVHVTDTN